LTFAPLVKATTPVLSSRPVNEYNAEVFPLNVGSTKLVELNVASVALREHVKNKSVYVAGIEDRVTLDWALPSVVV
jgi:hypothetical protein